jgi:curved DNA-binding protein CbpA
MKENWEIHWKDYYKILQVHQLAEQEVIEVAFRKLAGMYHPDHNKSPDAEQKMRDLIEAHEILGNPAKKTVYDTKYNQKDFIPIPPKSEVKANQNVTNDDTTQSRWQNVTQLIWCGKCKQKTNMLIAFVDKRPAYGTCPICHTFWDKRPYFDSQPKHTNPHPKTRPYPDWDE